MRASPPLFRNSQSLHLIVGGLLIVSTFLVSFVLSVYQYRTQRHVAYSDLAQRQELVLDKIADRCTIALATFDLPQIQRILAAAVEENALSYAGFGILDVSGTLQAAVPSQEFVESNLSRAQGGLRVMIKPVQLKRWNAQGREQIIPLGRIVGIFSAAEVEARMKRLLTRMSLILLLCCSFGVFAGYWVLNRLIVRPIRDLVLATERMASGRFDVSLDDSGQAMAKEIRILRDAMAQMADTLSGIVGAVQATSEQVAASSQSLTQITQQSSLNIAQIVQVMSQISQNTGHVAQSTQAAASSGQHMGSNAREGGKLAVRVVEKMKEAQYSVSAAAGFISELGKRSSQIGKIVEVITKIADQTNLLSLNAAIEAARAGESGRGFSVVASEIRTLAETSSESAQQINELISEVRRETQRAVETTENGNRKVAESFQLAQEAEKLFSAIARDVTEATLQITQVAANTQQVAAATQEATASGQEQAAAMERVAMNAQELALIVKKLNALAAKFKLA